MDLLIGTTWAIFICIRKISIEWSIQNMPDGLDNNSNDVLRYFIGYAIMTQVGGNRNR